MKYVPLGNNVLLEELKQEGGIITPTEFSNTPMRAKVLSVGTSRKFFNPHNTQEQFVSEPTPVHIGDVVLFFERDAKKLALEIGTRYIIDSRDILLVEQK